jgi:hypothetical protein
MSTSTIPDLAITLRDRGRGRVAALGLLALLVTPIAADAQAWRGRGGVTPPARVSFGRASSDHLYRYRQESTLLLTPSGHVLAVPTVTPVPGNASYGAPLHGIVCSKGMIAELPVERQHLYIDGATVGFPGQRCLNFSQQ